jgi:hypothetical protein
MLLMPAPACLQSAQAQLLEKKALSLQAARRMVAAAEAEAERNHWRGVVAIVDDGGWLILLEQHPRKTNRSPRQDSPRSASDVPYSMMA